MLVYFRRLSSDVIIYGAGRVALQAVGFITLPIFTRIFSPDDYGIIETITTFTSIVALFATLGLESASQRSYFDYTAEEKQKRQTVLSTTFWIILIWSTGLASLFIMISYSLATRLSGDSRYSLLLGIAFITIPITTITNFLLDILRLWHRPVYYSLLSLFSGIVAVGLALYLVAIYGWGLIGNYTGTLLGALLSLGLSYWIVHKGINLTFDWQELRKMLAYGLPMLPVAASIWVLQLADRFFLLYYASQSELGLYGLGVRLSNLLLFGVTALGVAWAPFILELHSRDILQERRVRAQALTYVTLGLSLGAVCLSVFAREFFLIVTPPSFVNAYQVVGLLSASIVVIGINTITITGISLARQTHYFARYTLLAAAINIGLNFVLIPWWGMVGAALATLLAYVALAWLYYRQAQILDPVPYNGRRLLTIILSAAVLIAVGTFINVNPIWFSLVLKIPLTLAFPVLIWRLGGLDPQSFTYLANLIRRNPMQAKG